MAAISSTTPAVKSLWERLFAVPPGLSKDEERLHNTVGVGLPLGWLVHFFYIFLFAFWGVWPLSVFNIFSVLLYTLAIYLWRQQRFMLVSSLVTMEVIIHYALAIILIGWGFGVQYYLFLGAMINVLNTGSQRSGTIFFNALYMLLFIGGYYYTVLYPPMYTVPAPQLAVFNILNIVTIFVAMGAIVRYLLAETDRADKANEDLLNNVLPKSIASRLKETDSTIADGFQNASILFADLTGFTRLSLKLKPDDLVEMLDTIFSRFDELVDQYGLEKIKTIGDAYMAAGGIPVPTSLHALDTVRAAMEIKQYMQQWNAERAKLDHSANAVKATVAVLGY